MSEIRDEVKPLTVGTAVALLRRFSPERALLHFVGGAQYVNVTQFVPVWLFLDFHDDADGVGPHEISPAGEKEALHVESHSAQEPLTVGEAIQALSEFSDDLPFCQEGWEGGIEWISGIKACNDQPDLDLFKVDSNDVLIY